MTLARQANEAWDRQNWSLFDQLLAAKTCADLDAICKAATDAAELEEALEAHLHKQRTGEI